MTADHQIDVDIPFSITESGRNAVKAYHAGIRAGRFETAIPNEITDEFLATKAANERLAAELESTRHDLAEAHSDLRQAVDRANAAEKALDAVRDFHTAWGEHDSDLPVDQLLLWEELNRLLNQATATPCPECANGKHDNCTGVVPDGDDYDHVVTCPCSQAGHEATR